MAVLDKVDAYAVSHSDVALYILLPRDTPYPQVGSPSVGGTYFMAGFDSVGGGRLAWQSTGSPNLTPASTTPALSGSLQGAHEVGFVS